jgi:hypothetical protein
MLFLERTNFDQILFILWPNFELLELILEKLEVYTKKKKRSLLHILI